jgi:hypothetical protein
VAGLRAVLEQRMRSAAPSPEAPELVLVVAELADVGAGHLETIREYGPAHGIHLLAASTRAVELGDALLGRCTTRAVLRLGSEADSTRVLGEPGASELAGGGDMLLRVDMRPAVQMRGFRVPPEHLAELVRLMQAAYPTGAPTPGPAPDEGSGPGDPPGAGERTDPVEVGAAAPAAPVGAGPAGADADAAPTDPAAPSPAFDDAPNGVCALDPALVSSDVHRFVALCEEAKALPPREAKAAYRAARALYGEDLLGGRPYAWLEERDETGMTLPRVRRLRRFLSITNAP